MTDSHPLDLAARAGYEAFRLVTETGSHLPPWDRLPPKGQEHWRAVADAVQMVSTHDQP